MSVAGAVIVWYKIHEIGTISYFISAIASLLIFLLSLIVLEEDENGDSRSS